MKFLNIYILILKNKYHLKKNIIKYLSNNIMGGIEVNGNSNTFGKKGGEISKSL